MINNTLSETLQENSYICFPPLSRLPNRHGSQSSCRSSRANCWSWSNFSFMFSILIVLFFFLCFWECWGFGSAEAERHGNEDRSNDIETDGEEISQQTMEFVSVNIKICLCHVSKLILRT